MNNSPIGLFDSGLGGLTITRALKNILPNESLIYFADQNNLPFGNKKPSEIIAASLNCADFLMKHQIKLLVIACHTATIYALKALQEKLSIPVVGVVESTINCIPSDQRCLILATEKTIESKVYQSQKTNVIALACPELVSWIEKKQKRNPTEKSLSFYRNNIDTVILACTHFPLASEAIQQALGDSISLIDPANKVAEDIHKLLIEKNLQNTSSKKSSLKIYTSGNPQIFKQIGIQNVEKKREFMKLF